MVTILPQKKNLGSSIGQSLGAGFQQGMSDQLDRTHKEHDEMKQTSKLREALINADKIFSDPNIPQQQKFIGLQQALAGHPEVAKQIMGHLHKQQQLEDTRNLNNQTLRTIEQQRGLQENSLQGDPAIAANVTKPIPQKAPPGGLTGQPVPQEVSNQIGDILQRYPTANSDELKLQFDKANIPPAFSSSYVENRRRQDESRANSKENILSENRKQTLPLKQEIIERANIARESVKNKSHLIDLINKGDINDPTYATFLESLPFNLGKRLLSNDTVEYKSGLVDEFRDLKNIFQGATRVKEVQIYENKLADLYLDDSQKKAILASRIDASKADIIKEEAAQEIEEKYPDISALQFNKKVNDLAKEKMNNLFDSVWGKQKDILDQAEKRKSIPLDINDPEDYKIMNQIFLEASGDAKKALELAKKKGYKIQE